MIRITFQEQANEKIAAALRARGVKVISELQRALDLSMLKLQQRIQRKLSGEVLNIRSGKLIGSINKEPTVLDNNQLTGSVTGAGGPAWYGRLHEYGGTFATRRRVTSKRGVQRGFRKGSITFPERSFMRSSLDELSDDIMNRVRAAMDRAVRE